MLLFAGEDFADTNVIDMINDTNYFHVHFHNHVVGLKKSALECIMCAAFAFTLTMMQVNNMQNGDADLRKMQYLCIIISFHLKVWFKRLLVTVG